MSGLIKQIKSWRRERGNITSPALHDKKSYMAFKKALTRAWISADYNDSQLVIRIPYDISTPAGKSNNEKLEKLGIME